VIHDGLVLIPLVVAIPDKVYRIQISDAITRQSLVLEGNSLGVDPSTELALGLGNSSVVVVRLVLNEAFVHFHPAGGLSGFSVPYQA